MTKEVLLRPQVAAITVDLGQMMSTTRRNVIVVMSDTLRTAYLGCYGNQKIHTPNIDLFASSATIFTEVYPESLPTIPVRRAIHTGRRAYPFRNYRPVPWDIVYLPGWQPMADDESTLAEDLVAAGYHTGFVTDTLPYFAPAMNFTRGFRQWEFIRGKQNDRWKSVYIADPNRMNRTSGATKADPYNLARCHIANTDGRMDKDTCCAGRSFRWAIDFLSDNASVPFYLLVDVFDPHEPWDAPPEFYYMYADRNYRGQTVVHTPYTRDLGGLTEEQVHDVIAHYSGQVSLVDYWFGRLLDALNKQDLEDKTTVIFTSDHGTNLGDNLWRVIGKPDWALLPGTMHIPLIVRDGRFPSSAGQRVEGLRYNIDVPATVYEVAGATSRQPIHGRSLLPALAGIQNEALPYLTCRYGDTVWYRDSRWWVFGRIDRSSFHVFDLANDPDFQHDLADKTDDIIELAWRRILNDAGGEIPKYSTKSQTDAIGQTKVRY